MEDRFDLRLQMPGDDRLRDSVRDRGTPSVRIPLPCGFGMSTAFIGGGKYDPDDIRFQILYRLPARSSSKAVRVSSSTPGAP